MPSMYISNLDITSKIKNRILYSALMSFWSREAANVLCLIIVLFYRLIIDLFILQVDPDLGSVLMIDKANKELVEVAQRSEPSVLHERLFEGLVAMDWMSEVRKELAVRCPVVNNILSVLLDMSHHHDKKNLHCV